MAPNFIFYLLILYFLPLLTVIYLSKESINSWTLLSVGFFLTFMGSLVLFALWRRWEGMIRTELGAEIAKERNLRQREQQQRQEVVAEISTQDKEELTKLQSLLTETQKKQELVAQEHQKKQEEVRKLESERERYIQKIDSLQRDLKHSHETTQNELTSKTQQVDEWQKVIAEQQSLLQKKQEIIVELETKIADLNYEVKTLIQLSALEYEEKVPAIEKPTPSVSQQAPIHIISEEQEQVASPEEASLLLKRCVDIAQKLSGTSHFMNSSSRFRDLHMDSYALDLRRLYDSLRSEIHGTVLIYSQKENKVLFVNDQTQYLLGWTPDQMLQQFPHIVEENNQEWQKGISSLVSQPETKISLQIKARSGNKIPLFCHLRSIPTGVFRSHLLGVLYRKS